MVTRIVTLTFLWVLGCPLLNPLDGRYFWLFVLIGIIRMKMDSGLVGE